MATRIWSNQGLTEKTPQHWNMTREDLLPNKESKSSRKCCWWLCKITLEAFLEEEDLLHYIGRIQSSISRSVIGALILLLSYTLSILSLTFGILSLGSCPCQPVLPTFLIVHGSAMAIRCLFDTGKLFRRSKRETTDGDCSPCHIFSKICGILITFWTITGSVWVYSVVAKVDTTSNISRNFCDPMLYWYSVVLVSIVLFGLLIKGIFLLVISMVYCKYENRTCYSNIINESLGEFV